tara:strand:+ start:100 stop:1824 length:1725 start_codon:yes stop_codon:yes gene_type:complete
MQELNNIVDNIKNKNLEKALKLCDLYENNKNKHIILNFRGVIFHLKNNLDLAKINFINAIKVNEQYEDPIKNLCILLLKKKLFKDFLFYAKKLVDIDKLNPDYNFQLAFAFELNDQLDDSLKYYEICSKFQKNKKKALNNIGSIYLKKKKLKIALSYFLQASEIEEDETIINNIFKCYVELRDQDNTKIYFEKAKKINENNLEFLFNKVKYLILKNEIENAILILNKNRDETKFLITLIRLLYNIGKSNEAENIIDQIKEKNLNNPYFYNFYSLRLLSDGNFDEGWKYYEKRNEKKINYFKDIKEWSGEEIGSKNIVVFSEQGLGDCIQFSKYLIPLTKISNHVTFVVQSNIRKLFRREIKNLSIDIIENCKDKKFDLKITLGSIIRFFYKEKIKDNLIIQNYESNIEWKNKLSKSKLNIGLVWSGSFNGTNEPYRSIPLSSLKKILSLNANFYCLQNEIWERDHKFFKSSNLINFGKYKLDEIASIVKNLDLVITVDTSLLHLAASLNIKTWALICLNPDWRWSEFNKINPYNNLEIFRQKKFNDWSDSINEIYKKLKTKIELNQKKLKFDNN